MNGYRGERALQFFQELQERLQALPGIESIGLSQIPLLQGWSWSSTIRVEGYDTAPGEQINPYFNGIGPGYFATLGIPLLEGRDFTPQDRRGAQQVVIINQQQARRYFGQQSAVGRRIGQGGGVDTPLDLEIIGVVGDVKYERMREGFEGHVYRAYRQGWPAEMTVYARTSLPVEDAMAVLQREVRRMDPHIPLFRFKTLERQIEESLTAERLVATLSGVFGGLATLLAATGLYTVMAASVARRTREIGIRMALGADTGRMLRLVLRETAWLAILGLCAGIPASLGAARFVSGQLFGLQATDPATFAVAALFLLGVALLAGTVPAARAARIDPIRALRQE